MLRRLRRPALLLLPVVLLASLTACGDDDGDTAGTYDGLDAVIVTGDFGKAPEVEWKGEMTADKVAIKTLVEGDGEAVKTGDKIETNVWIGNGYTQHKVYSTYDDGQPQTLTVDEDQVSKPFFDALEGQKLGSRVAITSPAEDLFGEAGNPQLQIGNKDTVVVILDLMEEYQEPKAVDVPRSKLPSLVLEDGLPTGFDFSGIPEPKADDELMRSVLKRGKGIEIKKSMTVKVNYLGMVYDAKKPFDENYSTDPVSFSLSQVVPGWTYGLSGMTVGSRVLLSIPPSLGYGAQEKDGIPANSTLYFVVNIVSAK